MKAILTRLLRSQLGFSIVQAVITGGIVAGLGLVVMKMNTLGQGNKSTSESSYGVLDLTGQIQTLVSNNAACGYSFMSQTIAPGGTVAINDLKSSSNSSVFLVNGLYSDNKVRITSMTLQRNTSNSVLTVRMEKNLTGKNSLGATIVNKQFFINAEWNASNILTSCSSDITNFMDTVVSQSRSEACESGSLGLVSDGVTCRILGQLGPADFACPAGMSIVSLAWNAATRIYTPVCRHLLGDIPTCTSDKLLRRNSAGVWSCVSINCPANSIAQGLDAAGNMRCTSCPSGTYMVYTAGGWQCKAATCVNTKDASQQYFVGFNTNGDAICNPIIDSATLCPKGATLKVDAAGKVSMDCCSPSCGNSALYCAGTAVASDNGCGTCTGTKNPDCSNAGSYCTGTKVVSANGCGYCTGSLLPDCSNSGAFCSGRPYPATNNCGVCTGSKATDCSDSANYCNGETYNANDGCGTCNGTMADKNADWSGWTATSEYQVKPGATCSASCGNGWVQTQRKYTRVCTNNEKCGGATCSGSTFTWVDEGSNSCNLADCCTPVTVWSNYTCAKTIAGKHWINNCFYKSVCSQNHSMLLSGPWWDGVAGPTSSGTGDTGTQANCHSQRLKCSGEP